MEAFNLEAKVKIFGVGPVVERFIESQARATQDKSVAFMRDQLAGERRRLEEAPERLEVQVLLTASAVRSICLCRAAA